MAAAKVIYRLVPDLVIKASKQVQNQDAGDRIPWPLDWYTIAQYSSRNPHHCACLQVKANCTLGRGYNLLGLEEREEADLQERLKQINPRQSFQEILNCLALDYETFGNAYLEIVRNAKGEVVELYHLPAILAWLRPGERGVLYENETNRQEYPFYRNGGRESHSVLHLAQYSPLNRHYGLPDWLGCLEVLELDYYATRYNQKFFVNSAIPDMAVIVEGGALDEDAEKAIVEFFQTSFKGLDNAHRTLFLPVNSPDVKIRFEKLVSEIKDASFDKLLQICRDRIISAHRVPPRLVGVSQPGSLGGTSEVFGQLSIFQDLIISPRQSYFASKLTPVLREMGYPTVELHFNPMDTTAQETDSDYYTKLVSGGIITVNEAREELGYPALDHQTEPLVKGQISLIRSLQRLREVV